MSNGYEIVTRLLALKFFDFVTAVAGEIANVQTKINVVYTAKRRRDSRLFIMGELSIYWHGLASVVRDSPKFIKIQAVH